jgi:hypothetical protein
MINSTRLPKVIFSKAPRPTPNVDDTFSVAYVRSPVRGTIARAFNTNVIIGCNPAAWLAIPRGTNTRSKFSQVRRNIWRSVKTKPLFFRRSAVPFSFKGMIEKKS